MEKMLKRLLCAAVVLAMVLTWLPGGLPKASAAEADPYENVAESEWQDWDGKTAISKSGYYKLTGSASPMTGVVNITKGLDVHIDLNGCTLTAAAGARAFYVYSGGSLSVTDLQGGGMITGSGTPVEGRGGLIYMNGGAFNLYGGEITGGKATLYGGNLYVTNSGTIHIAGGTVSGGFSDVGGNIAVMYSNLSISDGTVTGGSASSHGGNIYSTGTAGKRSTVTISGGTVENVAEGSKSGSVFLGGGAETVSTVLILSGGTLYGETYANYIASCTISGAPVVEKLRLAAGMLITPETMEAGASIAVMSDSGAATISGALKNAENYLPYFHAYETGRGVGVSDNKLIITDGCICGCGTAPADVVWQPVTYTYLESQAEKGALYGSQHYYLAEDLTLTADVNTLEIYGNVVLDLRGQTITPVEGSRTVYVNTGSTLGLMDTVGGGTLTGGTPSSKGGGAVYVADSAVFNLYSGNVTGGTLTGASLYGGAVYVAANGTFHMYGGTISGGSARQGGNIYTAAATSTVNLLGGTVSGGTATGYNATGDGRGGNIYMKAGKVTVSGSARVTGGHAVYDSNTSGRGGNIFAAAGTLIISGSARITGGIADKFAGNIMFTGANVTVSGNARITGGKSGGDNADNIINMYGDLTIAENAVVDAGTADGCGTSILLTGSTSANTGAINASTLTVSGGTLKGVVSANGYAESITLSGSPVIQHLNLTASGVLVTPTELQTGASITVEAVDSIISGELENAADCAQYFHAYAEDYTVAAVDNMLQIVNVGCPCGCETADGQVDWQAWTGEAISESGHYRLMGDSIIDSEIQIASGLEVTVDLYGNSLGAIDCRVFHVSGELNIIDSVGGGTVTGGTATKLDDSTDLHGRGGNIYMNSGSVVNLYGGTITNGTATSWTVLNDAGKTVSASGQDGHGGNIFVGTSAVLNMYGGTISGGVSNNDTTGASTSTVMGDNRGGNIYVNGTFNMYGGTLSGGSASRGGNICSTGTVRIYDGNIQDGYADWDGSNIVSTGLSCTVSVYGGTISGGNKNGVYMMYSTLRVSGGTIEDAVYAGSSTSTNYSTIYITGGTITGAITDSSAEHTFVISGGTLSSVNLKGTKTFVISGAPTIKSLTLASGVLVTPVHLSTDASITLTSTAGVFTEPFEDAETYKNCFISSETVEVVNGALAEVTASGTCGSNLTWQLAGSTLYISGTGAMTAYSRYTWSGNGQAPWYSYRSSITSVVIGEGVTSIGNYAFYNHSYITTITIPSSVTSIGTYAFYNTGLTTVNYLGTSDQWSAVSVSSSGNSAFTAVTPTCIGDTEESSGTTVSDMVWSYADGTLTISGTNAMPNYYYDTTYTQYNGTPWADQADQITKVVVNGCTTVGAWAFAGLKNLTSVSLNPDIETIGNNAFRGCTSLETISLGNIYTIEHNAFRGCTALAEVTSDGGLGKVGDYAFYGCSSLVSVEGIDPVDVSGSAFRGCTALKTMDLYDRYSFQNGAIIWNDSSTGAVVLLSAPGASGSFAVPDEVTAIADYAFAENTVVTNITVPDSVTKIGGAAFDGCTGLQTVTLSTGVNAIGMNAFANCDNLTAITVAEGNATYASDVNGALYSKDMTTLVQVPGGTAGSYTVADTVTTVDERAFAHNVNLTKVVLPSAATEVGKWAFSCAENLAEVTIPVGVTAVNLGTFECTGLTDVYYLGNTAQWAGVSVASYNEPLTTAAVHCVEVAAGTCGDGLTWLVTSDGVLTISGTGAMKDYAAYTMPWYANKAIITSVVIEEGVTSIGASAFAGFDALTNATIAKSVTTIGANAFSGTELTTVSYGGSENLWKQITIGEGNELLTTATIEYTPAKIIGLQIQTLPTKLSYVSGEELDTTGLVLVAVYDDNTTTEITEGYEVSCDLSAPGTRTVTVTYGAFTASFEVNMTITGTCGEDLTWALTGDGKLTITGTGEMTNYTWGGKSSPPDTPWADYLDLILSVEIGDGVTTVGRAAFWKAGNLTSVRLPEGITSIGAHSFRECGKLESVEIPSTVKTINSAAFYQCTSLTSVELPDSVTSLSTSVFGGCTALEHVTIGSGVSAIQSNVFSDCSALQTITYHGSRTKWAQVVAEGAVAETVVITYTERDAVSITADATNAKQEYLMNEELDTNGLVVTVFYDDGESEVLESGYSVNYDFTVSGTVTVSYEEKETTFTVTVIPAGACGEELTWVLRDGVLTITGSGAMADYSAESAAPWAAYADQIIALAIGDAVTTIGAYAFSGCTALVSAAIPESVTVIGEYAFDGCTALESALYGGNASKWASVAVGEGNEPLLNAVEFAVVIVYGDVNGDSFIDISDANLILQLYTGWDVEIDITAADVNNDKVVDISDANLILQVYTGWDVTLGPQ